MKTSGLVTVCRDIALTALGLGGIVHQELVGPVKWELLVVYTTVLGIPGAASILALRSGGTESPPSSSPPDSSPSESASSSSSW